MSKFAQLFFVLVSLWTFSACGKLEETKIIQVETTPVASVTPAPPTPTPEPTTASPIGKIDFRNYTYPLPRGWQDETREITLENGKAPVSLKEDERKIGARYVKKQFGDVTGDGQDEAFVVIKLETGGSAIPQMVYIFEWQNDKPEIVWYFRTGDRADGGLKDLRAENGELVVELYGQDRYIYGDVETLKIVGDEEQLCCPTHFTRNRYKLTNGRFIMQGERLTYSIAEPNSAPIENMGELEKVKGKR